MLLNTEVTEENGSKSGMDRSSDRPAGARFPADVAQRYADQQVS